MAVTQHSLKHEERTSNSSSKRACSCNTPLSLKEQITTNRTVGRASRAHKFILSPWLWLLPDILCSHEEQTSNSSSKRACNTPHLFK
jgi:hypothetical protein